MVTPLCGQMPLVPAQRSRGNAQDPGAAGDVGHTGRLGMSSGTQISPGHAPPPLRHSLCPMTLATSRLGSTTRAPLFCRSGLRREGDEASIAQLARSNAATVSIICPVCIAEARQIHAFTVSRYRSRSHAGPR